MSTQSRDREIKRWIEKRLEGGGMLGNEGISETRVKVKEGRSEVRWQKKEGEKEASKERRKEGWT